MNQRNFYFKKNLARAFNNHILLPIRYLTNNAPIKKLMSLSRYPLCAYHQILTIKNDIMTQAHVGLVIFVIKNHRFYVVIISLIIFIIRLKFMCITVHAEPVDILHSQDPTKIETNPDDLRTSERYRNFIKVNSHLSNAEYMKKHKQEFFPDEEAKPFDYKEALLIVGGVIILAAVVYVWFLYETRVPTEIEPTLNDLNDIYQKGVSQIYEQSTKPFNET